MDLYDFYNTFITAVAGDSAIESWCQAQFSDSLQVFADLSSTDLPTADDMPYAIFHMPEAVKHQDRRVNDYVLSVDLALDKNALASRAESNVEQPAGIELILDLATLVFDAVKAALPANTSFGYRLLADTLGSLPEIYGYIDLEFSEQVTIGTDPLA